MLARIFIFIGLFIVILGIDAFIFLYAFWYRFPNWVFIAIPLVALLFAVLVIASLVFRHNYFLSVSPYYLAGLQVLILIFIIVPIIHSNDAIKQAKIDSEFAAASRDFICSDNSFISYDKNGDYLIMYTKDSGKSSSSYFAKFDKQAGTITPNLNGMSVEGFIQQYSCKDASGKTIFDYYKFEPLTGDKYFKPYIGREVVIRGEAKNGEDGAGVFDIQFYTKHVLIDMLSAWPNGYEGKTVLVSGLLDAKTVPNPHYNQNKLGKGQAENFDQYILKNPKYEILK